MKKQDIFKTALRLIAIQGLHATPMSQIANEANVAAGTIYHYFKSKEEMILELYKSVREEMEYRILSENVEKENYEVEYTSLCLRVFKFLIENPDQYYFLQQYDNSPMSLENGGNSGNREFPVPESFFLIGKKNNLLKNLPLSLISNLTYKSMVAMAGLHLAHKIVLEKEMILLVIDGCWEMIRK